MHNTPLEFLTSTGHGNAGNGSSATAEISIYAFVEYTGNGYGTLKSDLCHEWICGGLIKVRARHRDVTNISSLEDYRFFTQPDIEVEDRQAGSGVF